MGLLQYQARVFVWILTGQSTCPMTSIKSFKRALKRILQGGYEGGMGSAYCGGSVQDRYEK